MKCQFCGRQKNKEWIEISLGHKRLIIKCGCKTKKSDNSFSFHKHRDAVAFGVDKKTGKPLALDKKGRKFDPKDTRYKFDRDPHGWKVTGKKPRKTDKYGRQIYR